MMNKENYKNKDLNDRVESAKTELYYLSKSKKLITKNIKNEDEKIQYLNNGKFNHNNKFLNPSICVLIIFDCQ